PNTVKANGIWLASIEAFQDSSK
ncbi:hypothetical protein ACN42_g11766, partial [Penicillium freii]